MGKSKTQQLITEAKQLLIEGDKYQAYRRLLMIEDLIGGPRERLNPPRGRPVL